MTLLTELGGHWGEELHLDAESLPALSPFDSYIEHWIDCVCTDRSPVTDGNERLASLELITAAYESSANGAFVELQHQ